MHWVEPTVRAWTPQVRQLTKEVSRKTTSGAKTDRSQLRKALYQIDAGDVLMVTGAIDAGSSHARHDHRRQSRIPLAR
jgi:hypothetical protein